MLVLLAPGEEPRSLANLEFECPPARRSIDTERREGVFTS